MKQNLVTVLKKLCANAVLASVFSFFATCIILNPINGDWFNKQLFVWVFLFLFGYLTFFGRSGNNICLYWSERALRIKAILGSISVAVALFLVALYYAFIITVVLGMEDFFLGVLAFASWIVLSALWYGTYLIMRDRRCARASLRLVDRTLIVVGIILAVLALRIFSKEYMDIEKGNFRERPVRNQNAMLYNV